MGDLNQLAYLKKRVGTRAGPVLEVGSKDYGNTSSFRDYFLTNDYVGVDLEAGDGVDYVWDLTSGVGELKKDHFAVVICCSVLEHVRRPWDMAANITDLLRCGGLLYVAVPWVWRYHPYPDDYYRFSHKGIAELFPGIAWEDMHYATNVRGEFTAIRDKSDSKMRVKRLTFRGIRKYLPYLMVNMIGTKK